MRTANPALTENTFRNFSRSSSDAMTIDGVVYKSLFLIFLVFATSIWSWGAGIEALQGQGFSGVPWWYWGSLIGALVTGLVLVFKKEWSSILAPVYALLEGISLGFISAIFEFRYPGIVIQAILGTFSVFFVLLMTYKTGMIKATENFKLGVVAATGGIALVYLISLGLNLFGIQMPYIHDSGPIGIGFSVVVVIIAALNLVLDFDFIEKGAQAQAPKYMEWYASFGLLVTLIWLYLEILRLLGKTRKN